MVCVSHVQTEVWEMIAEQTLELRQNVPEALTLCWWSCTEVPVVV